MEMPMKTVLVVGQGGREHALVWKLAQSPQVKKIYAAPGNPGIAELAECVDIGVEDIDSLVGFAVQKQVDLTVIGPEAPLMAGLADRLRALGLLVFGPSAAAARLEGSKVFAKELLQKYQIPTARFESFSNLKAARDYAFEYCEQGLPVVIKADGLAAGKGVVVAASWEEANAALEDMMLHRRFGSSGDRVIIEECLQGEEVSFFAISDGKEFIPLLAAQDHKRVFDDDQGPNTGGMGAYVNPPVFTDNLQNEVISRIIKPVIAAMEQEGCPYQGVLYAGLMITENGPQVLEFNARFGDPETQAVLALLDSPLGQVLNATATGTSRSASQSSSGTRPGFTATPSPRNRCR